MEYDVFIIVGNIFVFIFQITMLAYVLYVFYGVTGVDRDYKKDFKMKEKLVKNIFLIRKND